MADTPNTPPVTRATPLLTLDAEALAAMVWRLASAELFPETPDPGTASRLLQHFLSTLLPLHDPELGPAQEPVRMVLLERFKAGQLPGRDAW